VVLMKILQVYTWFEVLTAFLLKVTVFWYIIPFWLIICYWHFEWAWCLCLQGSLGSLTVCIATLLGLPCIWRQQGPPNCWYQISSQHGVMF
jgi:hypothetical protein